MGEIIATYDYRDEKGTLLYQNCRFEPKDFRQRTPDGGGGWTWGRNGTPATLYRLPELLASALQDWVIVVEGEKDCESLRALGFTATTSGGVDTWKREYAEHFRGRLVAICGDADKPGQRYKNNVANSLAGMAAEVRIVELLDGFKDITDFIDDHDHLDEQDLQRRIHAMIDAGKPVKAKPADAIDPSKIVVENAGTYLTTEPPEPDQILLDMFDRGDKVAIIGSSKLRKSFVTLQMGLSLASGRDFLSWAVPKPRRVFYIQFEIQATHFHRRVRRLSKAMSITPGDLSDRLKIVNGRGLGITGPAGIRQIAELTEPFEPDVIVLDPLYKIAAGVENAAEDMKIILNAFDQLAEATNASVIYVHHDAKGFVGDRDIRDRGAGSNVLSRDYDACFTLTPHVSEPDAAVVEILLRNYRPQEDRTIGWTEDPTTGGYSFELKPDLAPTKRTSANAKTKNEIPFEAQYPIALSLVKDGPQNITEFRDLLTEKTGMKRERSRQFMRWLLTKPEDAFDVHKCLGRGQHLKWIGTAAQIARKKVEECGER